MKKFAKTSALLALLLFVVTSCQSKKNVYTDGQNPNGGYTGNATGPLAGGDTGEVPQGEWAEDGKDVLANTNDGVLVPAEQHGYTPVYFAYNSASIGTAEEPKLKSLASYLEGNPTYHLILGGHCDERGSEEYNRALSERRALAVKDFIVGLNANLEARINTVGYGEEQLVDLGKTPEAHALNRRAEIEIRDKR